jgi:hypothetical protein
VEYSTSRGWWTRLENKTIPTVFAPLPSPSVFQAGEEKKNKLSVVASPYGNEV